MRIAHVTPVFPPSIGGMERYVDSLARFQAGQGHEVCVFTSDLSKRVPEKMDSTANGVKVLRLRSLAVQNSPLTISLAPRLCRSKFDVIHQHVFHFFYPETSLFVSRLRKTPLISHVHMDPDMPSGFVLQKLYKRISTHVVVKMSNAIIVPTLYYADLIRRKYGRQDGVFVIPSGLDADAFSTKRLSRKTSDILFVGRISHQKGVDLLIQAMPKIIESVPTARLKIVGSVNGTGEDKYIGYIFQMITDLKLGNYIDFLGGISDSELKKVLQESTVFVAPSRFESFGIVLLEAMASGIPIVASNLSVFKEVIQDSGLLVDPSPRKLSGCIVDLLSNQELSTVLTSKGLERVRMYSWERIGKEIMQVYDRCMRYNKDSRSTN